MIELIAAIAIMGVLMLVAIPSVFSITENNKKTTYLNDAKRLITAAKAEYKRDLTIPEPTTTLCLVFRLKDLDKTDLQTGPNRGKYNQTYSYVTINYDAETKKYTYGVQLLEEYEQNGVNNYRGIAYTKESNLTKASIQKTNVSTNSYTNLATLASASSQICPGGLIYADGSTGSGTS